ncbi:hypothetical protein DFR49_0884 [Hephaestia caeni]|uniref:Uncharacterized protein n=1 Tax=Hephaestia caeni TaxID=645617 RepID=A0A397PGF9_9SPHN|nr:hypothetical protein [Hephaestia caeni]RIA46345.1 hypothetical protein DFR49_0884 [Hephaestia caeni]
MGITRVMAFVDPGQADQHAGSYVADGYKVIRIDKPDIIELMKPGSQSQYWYSNEHGADADYILLIATKDNISIS